MRRVGYVKTDGGAVVVSMKETHPPETSLEKVEALFDLFGFEGWELPLDEIVATFEAAIDQLVELHRAERENTIREHSSRNWFVRSWREFRGYREPAIVTRDEVVVAMTAKLRRFSAWAADQQHRPFYMGSNMRPMIDGAVAVAKQLELSQERK